MAPNPDIMRAISQLDYRVTAGDVAAKTGMELQIAEQGLLALAADVGGHMQVSDEGELAYAFPRGMQGILQSKYFRLRLQEWWNKVWGVLFYIIRISFGIVLIASIVLILLTIVAIFIAINSQSRDNDRGGGFGGNMGGNRIFVPTFWIGPNWFYAFQPPSQRRYYRQTQTRFGEEPKMSFLEAIFSFLFGDGNPNADLEERRWQTVATVIRNNGGTVVAEQIAPYLDDLGGSTSQELEDYMLPVLTRFNGRPEVSPEGQLVYRFPELQVMAKERGARGVAAYLKELPWRFSEASSGQLMGAIALGAVNFVGALALGSLLRDAAIAELGGLVGFTSGIFGFLLAYAVAFLGVPLARYFWVQWRNQKVEARNEQRQERAIALNQADDELQKKLTFASEFATRTLVTEKDLAYTTERDLTEQEIEQKDKIDEEWQKRLEGL